MTGQSEASVPRYAEEIIGISPDWLASNATNMRAQAKELSKHMA